MNRGSVVLLDVLTGKVSVRYWYKGSRSGMDARTYVLRERRRLAGDHDVVIVVAGTRIAANRGSQPRALQCA